MVSKSNFGIPFIFLFAITSLVGPIDGRKDPGEYWGEVMKGQPMPETIKVFVNQGQYEVEENKATPKDFVDDFGSTTPDATVIYGSVNPTKVRAQIFRNDFDSTTPDATIIYDEVKPTEVRSKNAIRNTHDGLPSLASKKLLLDDFEQIPNIFVYNE